MSGSSMRSDESEEGGGGVGGTCSLRGEVRAFASGIVSEIADIVSKDLVRVAAMTFSNVARMQFNFADNNYNPDEIENALKHIPFDAGVPTFAHTAFELLEKQVLVPGSQDGFRHFAAPVMVIVLTDGRTMIPGENIDRYVPRMQPKQQQKQKARRTYLHVEQRHWRTRTCMQCWYESSLEYNSAA